MNRKKFLNQAERPQTATISFSPKGGIYVSGENYILEKGNHPFGAIEDFKFFYVSERFFCYGLSRDKQSNYYATSYKRLNDTITLYERNGGDARQVAKGTVDELKKDYKLSTGVLVTVVHKEKKELYCIDLKFQASSRSFYMDFITECRRNRNYPDFTIEQGEDKDFGSVYKFKRHSLEPSSEMESYIEEIEPLLAVKES